MVSDLSYKYKLPNYLNNLINLNICILINQPCHKYLLIYKLFIYK